MTDRMQPALDTGDVERRIRRVRWRRDLLTLQRATYRLLATLATAAAALVALALGASVPAFVVGLAGLAILALGATVWTFRAARHDWLGAAGTPAWIDRRAVLRGRLSTLVGLRSRAPAFFLPLLVAQTTEALAAWPPERLVPRAVPLRALAAALVAASVLVLLLVLAPLLRPPLPALVGGSAGPVREEQMDGIAGWLRRLVAGTTRPPATAGRDVGDDANGATAGAGTGAANASTLAGLPGALQARIRERLWGERWGRVDGSGEASGHGGSGGDRRVAGGGGQDQRGTVAADSARHAVATHAPEGDTGRDGDTGAGAGTGTDPDLFGATTIDGDPDEGHFALGLAARVRTSHEQPRRPSGDAPPAASDEHPELADLQRPDVPFHRMAVPSAYAAIVRAVFAHGAPQP
jgi:hypothetical protein